jgi:hypothetical protein
MILSPVTRFYNWFMESTPNLQHQVIDDIVGIGRGVEGWFDTNIGNYLDDRVSAVAKMILGSLPVVIPYFYVPLMYNIGFWVLYEVIQLRLPRFDRCLGIAVGAEGIRELTRFASSNLTTVGGAVVGTYYVLSALVCSAVSLAYFARAARNSTT